MKASWNIFLSWLPLAIAITGMCLLVQLAVQQNYRQSLNDPQIQMADDAASQLVNGNTVRSVVPPTQINIATSLSPWLGVYDKNALAVAASGNIDGSLPQPPIGVLEAAKNSLSIVDALSNENRVSWQPSPDVRQAIVAVYVPQKDLYVVAGRNMREVENREGGLNIVVGLAWLCMLGATLLAYIFKYRFA